MALDLKKFFTKQNEENGVVFPVSIGGETINITLYGPNSQKASKATTEFLKERDDIFKEEDEQKRAEMIEKALYKRISRIVGSITDVNGEEVLIDGKKISEETLCSLFENSPLIAEEVYKKSQDIEGFLDGKKSD